MKNDYRLTFRALLISLILSLAMAAANIYLDLKVGITISTFLLAALFLISGRVTGAAAVRTILFISGVV